MKKKSFAQQARSRWFGIVRYFGSIGTNPKVADSYIKKLPANKRTLAKLKRVFWENFRKGGADI